MTKCRLNVNNKTHCSMINDDKDSFSFLMAAKSHSILRFTELHKWCHIIKPKQLKKKKEKMPVRHGYEKWLYWCLVVCSRTAADIQYLLWSFWSLASDYNQLTLSKATPEAMLFLLVWGQMWFSLMMSMIIALWWS